MATEIVRRHKHRGMTLVELLMVISIMTILLVVAIPMIRPAFQDRNLREAARQVNAFFAGAQARAAGLGRPVGVWIERIDATEFGSRHASRLYMAEVAPSFTGAALDSRVRVSSSGITGTLQFDSNDLSVLGTIIARGERFTIKFDHKGYDYPGRRTASDTFEIEMPLGAPPGAAAGLAYEITRGPTRSSVNPLLLPADSVIDLSLSGMTSRREMDPLAAAPWVASPVIIMFAPSGRVDYMYIANQPVQPFAPIHLLIGRKARVVNPVVTDVSNPQTANLADPTCLWITISNRTGSIITSDNADTSFVPPGTLPLPLVPSARIRAAREFARSSVQKGGR
jgi:prepilin-type N-terminal cleavage/methylation domain-containing protein